MQSGQFDDLGRKGSAMGDDGRSSMGTEGGPDDASTSCMGSKKAAMANDAVMWLYSVELFSS